MDWASVVGLVLAVAGIFLGYTLDGGKFSSLIQPAAFAIVVVGTFGAVLGLIHVMENLSDPSRLGSGIAIAFVSTVYGVGLANLFLYPVGNKLKAIVNDKVAQYEIVAEVFADLAGGDHGRVVDERVASLLARH